MNILAVSVDYFPKVGGISLMTHHLCNALAEEHSVSLLAPKDAGLPGGFTPGRYELIVDSDSNPRLREGAEYPGEVHRIITLVEKLHQQHPIDHVLLFHPFYYGPPLLKFARQNKVEASCYIHGFELRSQLLKTPTIRDHLPFNQPKLLSLRASTIDLVRNIDEVLVNSSITGALVQEAGRKDFHITGCGVDSDDVDRLWISSEEKDDKSGKLKEKLGYPQGSFVMCFVGRIVPSKNIPYLLNVLAQSSDDTFLAVCGDGNLKEVKQQAEVLGVESRVRFLGSVSEQDKWDYLGAADALTLPSIILPGGQIEGFGIVMLEATLRGATVVVSEYGGMQDFVLDRNGFYIDVDHPNSFVQLIEQLKQNPALRKQTVARAQMLLREKLTWSRIASRITENWMPGQPASNSSRAETSNVISQKYT